MYVYTIYVYMLLNVNLCLSRITAGKMNMTWNMTWCDGKSWNMTWCEGKSWNMTWCDNLPFMTMQSVIYSQGMCTCIQSILTVFYPHPLSPLSPQFLCSRHPLCPPSLYILLPFSLLRYCLPCSFSHSLSLFVLPTPCEAVQPETRPESAVFAPSESNSGDVPHAVGSVTGSESCWSISSPDLSCFKWRRKH